MGGLCTPQACVGAGLRRPTRSPARKGRWECAPPACCGARATGCRCAPQHAAVVVWCVWVCGWQQMPAVRCACAAPCTARVAVRVQRARASAQSSAPPCRRNSTAAAVAAAAAKILWLTTVVAGAPAGSPCAARSMVVKSFCLSAGAGPWEARGAGERGMTSVEQSVGACVGSVSDQTCDRLLCRYLFVGWRGVTPISQ